LVNKNKLKIVANLFGGADLVVVGESGLGFD